MVNYKWESLVDLHRVGNLIDDDNTVDVVNTRFSDGVQSEATISGGVAAAASSSSSAQSSKRDDAEEEEAVATALLDADADIVKSEVALFERVETMEEKKKRGGRIVIQHPARGEMLLSSACMLLRDEKLVATRQIRITRKPLLRHTLPKRGDYSVGLGDMVMCVWEEGDGKEWYMLKVVDLVNSEDKHPVTKRGMSVGLSRVAHIVENKGISARVISYKKINDRDDSESSMFLPLTLRNSTMSQIDDLPLLGIFFWIHSAVSIDGGLRIQKEELQRAQRSFFEECEKLRELLPREVRLEEGVVQIELKANGTTYSVKSGGPAVRHGEESGDVLSD
uniref:Uncharacterized protein n=1 Tax=Chromera velia CCMP2878 TaxID=1169474 RepID=A0A0G4FT37_9ALVE|eukprot:Cvel_3721.t1-p1 / transcript=Cvel_3721.t1 / gene=Cvel_3721 / organism=Chromera_velia_CCMP2878 / gene_product=hypothetical protein / transcript_product=hypothetical protein / location=Cvel_scaffold154:117760-118764(-) / protein_length=335 / sequence_SO=supercontig / SO=protein_coding / is_pseudo=false